MRPLSTWTVTSELRCATSLKNTPEINGLLWKTMQTIPLTFTFILIIYWNYYTLDACMHALSFQLCPTLCDSIDHSLPGSSVHGDFPGKNTGVGCHTLLQGIFPTQGSNSCLLDLLHSQVCSLPLVLLGNPSTSSGLFISLAHVVMWKDLSETSQPLLPEPVHLRFYQFRKV